MEPVPVSPIQFIRIFAVTIIVLLAKIMLANFRRQIRDQYSYPCSASSQSPGLSRAVSAIVFIALALLLLPAFAAPRGLKFAPQERIASCIARVLAEGPCDAACDALRKGLFLGLAAPKRIIHLAIDLSIDLSIGLSIDQSIDLSKYL